jgi:hypothetical protein
VIEMTAGPLGELIATRWLDLDGERAIRVTLDAPRREPSGDYSCRVQIVGLGDDGILDVWGVDGFQALELAFLTIGTLLEASEEGRAGRITWDRTDRPANLGFPSYP